MSFGYDPYDAEWENPNTGRTAYRPSQDDDYCEICDGTITNDRCACDDECEGHPAGPSDPMGETVYCDGSCRRRAHTAPSHGRTLPSGATVTKVAPGSLFLDDYSEVDA